MNVEQLITDLKAAGANENTLRLAMNCYELGQKEGELSATKVHAMFTGMMVESSVRAVREALAQHFEAMPSREMFGGTVAEEIREWGQHARH
jgi:hypothetical protein